MTTWRAGDSVPLSAAQLEARLAAVTHASQHAPGGTDDAGWLDQIAAGVIAGRTVRTNVPPGTHMANGPNPAVSGTLYVTSIPMKAGDIINYLSFRSTATAWASLTHWYFALYDDNANIANAALLAQTADQLTAAWSANSNKILQLQSTVTIPRHGNYRAGVCAIAGTPGSYIGTFQQGSFWASFSWNAAMQPGGTIAGLSTGVAPATLAGIVGPGNTNVGCIASSNA